MAASLRLFNELKNFLFPKWNLPPILYLNNFKYPGSISETGDSLHVTARNWLQGPSFSFFPECSKETASRLTFTAKVHPLGLNLKKINSFYLYFL